MIDYTYSMGARGPIIVALQQQLEKKLGHSLDHGVDGRFGGATHDAVIELANKFSIREDGVRAGRAGRAVFEAVGMAWPNVFARCLGLTMQFEGTGFSGAEGPRETSDSAGVTYGCIGFTSYNGEVQELLREARLKNPQRFDHISFGHLGDKARLEMHARIAAGAGNGLFASWALIPTGEQYAGSVRAPVKGFLAELGCEDWFKALQVEWAKERYWNRALKQTAELFGDNISARPLALMFDVCVQNGGLDAGEIKDLVGIFTRGVGSIYDERERMTSVCNRLIARLRNNGRPPKIIDDVRSRKNTILLGEGKVHGENFVIRSYAL